MGVRADYPAQAGHTVTGCEGVPFVVEQFFRENKLDFEKTSLPEIKGWRFKVATFTASIYKFLLSRRRMVVFVYTPATTSTSPLSWWAR